jgi:hypothetical protein
MSKIFTLSKFRKGRYDILARRDETEEWTDWSSCTKMDDAFEHCEKVRNAGYKARVIDKKKDEVLIEDD